MSPPVQHGPDENHGQLAKALRDAQADAIHTAELMASIISHIPHGIAVYGPDRRLRLVNAAYEHIMANAPIAIGETVETIIERRANAGEFGPGNPATIAELQRAHDQSQPQLRRRQRPNGATIDVRTAPLPDGGHISVVTDVTPLIVAEQQAADTLRLAKQAAEAANTAKSRFLAAISTELRTPLLTMLGLLGGMARDAAGVRALQLEGLPQQGLDAAEIRHTCDTVSDTARRLLGLVDTILDVARVEAGRFALSDDLLDIPQLVQLCVRHLNSAAAAAEVALVIDLPESLPRIRGDERRLRQVLGHVIGNAVKFTSAPGSVSIAAREEWTSGDLLVLIQDTGTGLPESELERIFEPFNQINPVPTGRPDPSAGAGLGLYISRTLMRAHGGDLLLRSPPGEGTTAILRFPAERVLRSPDTDPT